MIYSPIDRQHITEAANSNMVSGTLNDNYGLQAALATQGYALPSSTRMTTVRRICQLIVASGNLDNELVKQKDRIYALISRGKITQAKELLYFLEPLWASQNYHYKFAELMLQIEKVKQPL